MDAGTGHGKIGAYLCIPENNFNNKCLIFGKSSSSRGILKFCGFNLSHSTGLCPP